MFNRVFNSLKWVFLVAYSFVLISGIFVPLYSDEIVIKFNVARFFIDGGEKTSLFPQCGNSVGQMISWLFYPAAISISLLYQDLQPLGIRVSGILFSFTWLGLLAYWCYRQTPENWSVRFTFICAFLALGVLPFLWVLSRSEQLMILTALILCIFAVDPPSALSKIKKYLTLLIVVVSTSIFFYVHPKSIFFTPFITLAVWLASRNMGSFFRFGLVVYVLLLAVQVYLDAGFISTCQDAPKLRALLSSNTLPPALLLGDPALFFDLALNNILSLPERMLNHLVFGASYQSGWLPPIENNPLIFYILNFAIYYLLYAFVVIPHFFILILCSVLVVRKKLFFSILLASMISVANIANVAFYVNQSFYDGIQYIFGSVVIIMLILQDSVGRPYALVKSMLSLFFIPIYFISILSLLTLSYMYIPILIVSSSQENANIRGQALSLPVFKVNNHIQEILELGASCNLPKNGSANLVVDHMTYFAYKENHIPIHVLYTATTYFGVDLVDGGLVPFLKKLDSPGVISRCEWFPEDLIDFSLKSNHGYCCVNSSNF